MSTKNYFRIVARNIGLLAIIFGFSIQPTLVSAQTTTTVTKWYPGHYVLNNLDYTQTGELLSKFADIPSFRGIQKTYYWSEIEPSKGVYDFSAIDKHLAMAKKYGKKLSIVIGYKYMADYKSVPPKSSLPNYVLNMKPTLVNGLSVPSYFVQDQGVDQNSVYSSGHNANFGHPGTLTAFTNLLKALSKKYDRDIGVSFIQFSETSVSANISQELHENFLNGTISMNQKARSVFLSTPLIQSLNYPRKKLAEFINNITINKMGYGGPDVYWGAFDDSNNGLTIVGTQYTAQGIYRYYPTNKGNLPIGMQVHRENLFYSTLENKQAGIPHNLSPADSVKTVYSFAYSRLSPNFLVWQVFGSGDSYRQSLEAALRSESMPLYKACPTVYNNTCKAEQ